MNDEVLIERDERSIHLVLNRPDRGNAFNASLVEHLLDALDGAYENEVPLLVLEGAGGAFSTGFDFSGFAEETDATLAYRFIRIETLLQRVAHAPFETLALAHGRVFGAGADLVGACSMRLIDPATTFRMPGLAFGIALGTRRFIQCCGDRARAILAESRSFDASEAQRIGFAHAIVEKDAWPQAKDDALNRAQSLPKDSARLLADIARDREGDADMGVLARSVTRPGLKDRMQAYRDAMKKT